ncbi:hypothetical protein D9758_017237 [Tetrapyrgos nigripes]|uniref:ubiquitinyl hydrolase 1 n=1 Tax=Tetrapyrgos nigripes TaxID=182062 RepID=A0A8H5C670_9AGAR|nr:hypothetical protein D9758_017237 [Tetrapyrgos nigripes]
MSTLDYIAYHVFLPPKLPQKDDYTVNNETALCRTVLQSATKYLHSGLVDEQYRSDWRALVGMLIYLTKSTEEMDGDVLENTFSSMKDGDVRACLVREQNAGVIFRKRAADVIYEAFEVRPPTEKVTSAQGKLSCTYPGPAISVPLPHFENPDFLRELSSFLVQMDSDTLDSAATSKKAGTEITEERDSAHPRYITSLLTGILRGLGKPADVHRIQKRIADEVLMDKARIPWRRSMVWLVIRVALQTHFARIGDNNEYKVFMIQLMCDILEDAVKARFVNDMLFAMRAKVAIRVSKLGSSVPNAVLERAKDVSAKVETLLETRWAKIQEAQAQSPPWDGAALRSWAKADSHLTMPKSRRYLLSTLSRKGGDSVPDDFSPNCSPRPLQDLKQFELCTQSFLEKAFASETYIALADLELSVQSNLDSWIDKNIKEPLVPSILFDIMVAYRSAASGCYVFPEDNSIMILTLFELWVALDKAVVKRVPLLAEFSPEVPLDLFEPLLLRKATHIHRLIQIHHYLRLRHEKAKFGSIFTEASYSNSFAVKFFNQTPAFQKLKTSIESNAEQKRTQKRQEWAQKRQEHKEKTDRARQLTCIYETHGQRAQHSGRCERCRLFAQASRLEITVHEWPLPSDSNVAKTVIFEMKCPKDFRIWRETTYTLLNDVCQAQSGPDPAGGQPSSHLYQYCNQFTELRTKKEEVGRISLASTTKSFLAAHYKSKKIAKASAERDVIVPNGLSWQLYDGTVNRWPAKRSFADANPTVAHMCTLHLPTSYTSYDSLQGFIESVAQNSNLAIAHQHYCRDSLSMHEFISFATLRSGQRLQWLNIAKEIRTRVLTFHNEEVHLLMTQAACQVGNIISGELERHLDLKSPAFCHTLLGELKKLLVDVQTNWMEVTTVRTIIMLGGRVLASIKDSGAQEEAFSLMLLARSVVYTWLTSLIKNPVDSIDDKLVSERQRTVSELALTCLLTYDVDKKHLPRLLTTPHDVSIFLECLIHRFDNTLLSSDVLPPHIQTLLHRTRRLSHFVEPVLRSLLLENRQGVDQALLSVWPAYRLCLDIPWSCLNTPNNRWVCASTKALASYRQQNVHLNILEGQLLVDGKSLTRLPKTMTEHSTFRRLFGNRLLEVFPSDSKDGLAFSSRSDIYGYQVHFDLRGSDLVIQAQHLKSHARLELIPQRRLFGDLPELMVKEYFHWIDLEQREIELRPYTSPWVSSVGNWRLKLRGEDITMVLDGKQLVDIHSKSFQMISGYLNRMEHSQFLTVTYSAGPAIDVDLPRFQLSFSVNSEGSLECITFPGMCVDNYSSIGTLYGLVNMLVLNPSVPTQPRRILIPNGRIRTRIKEHHVEVSVDTNPDEWKRTFFVDYTIREDLGYLEGDGSLTSHFLRAYLHALTSYCLPDPLTGRTGTEESLAILTSARSFSIQNLTDAQFLNILYQIASMTPSRTYYPENSELMQTVHWSNLPVPVLSQHPSFFPETMAILDYCHSLLKELQVDAYRDIAIDIPRWHVKSKQKLWLRDYLRNFKFYAAVDVESTAKDYSTDIPYTSRDLDLTGEQIACTVASAIFEPPSSPFPSISNFLKQWRALTRRDDVSLSLSYNKEQWLDTHVLSTHWLTLYDLCRDPSVTREEKVYQITFSFPSLAFRDKSAQKLLSLLIEFTTNPSFSAISAPSFPSYALSNGVSPKGKQLDIILLDARIAGFDWSSVGLVQRLDESDSDYEERCDEQFGEVISQLKSALLSQWPGSPSDDVKHASISSDRLMKGVRQLFESCDQNKQYMDHVDTVQAILNSVILSPLPSTSSQLQSYKIDVAPSPTLQSNQIVRTGIDYLLRRSPPSVDCHESKFTDLGTYLRRTPPASSGISQELLSLTQQISGDSNFTQKLLGKALRGSSDALSHSQTSLQRTTGLDLSCEDEIIRFITEYDKSCEREYALVHAIVYEALSPKSGPEQLLQTAGLWPRVTPYSLLRLLSYDQRSYLSDSWKAVLTVYAKKISERQRSQRLLSQLASEDRDGVLQEMANSSPKGLDDIDWLLVQISSNFLARDVQVDVANEMESPSSSENSVLQLNMGEGKSSVITPMIASSMADGGKLVRVVVLKALCTQMFQLLVDRVSNLVNRRVYYMPFSRRLKMDQYKVAKIQALYEECMKKGGILVVQPEHILSFRLMGLDRIVESGLQNLQGEAEGTVCRQLIESQRWLQKHTRDILDECDEILHVRYQLIYTLGKQGLLEDHPNRWTTIQEVFSLLLTHAPRVRQEFPLGIHIQDEAIHKGDFPAILIVSADARALLFDLIVTDILAGRLLNYPFERLPKELKPIVRKFLCNRSVSAAEVRLLSQYCQGSSSWNGLLLLRGLIAYGVLAYTLNERRWRVDYGLDEHRTLLAVPYRAKDVPSLRAEFGHPDVAISLTCLSYYYRGLTEGQLDTCFEMLMKSDNPNLEYERWARNVPEVPRTVNGINLRDLIQRHNVLIPYFSHNHAVVNFFLSEVVFPKYAKRFPEKLATSGWDLAEEKENFTTGFSGTKDSQYLLPATISQLDENSLGQESTNAQVIEYLLKPENNYYHCARGANNEPLSASDFLQLIQVIGQAIGKQIRVLLDVGAQILDMSNEAVARYWLELENPKDVQAAVYFNNRDQMMVLDRRKRNQKFISSQWRNQLDRCVIYLDDAHTRGTDLKLPKDYRAAVTLGPKVTKDRLTQGCMRMRKLGFGQSVMFFAPFKVDQRIREICGLDNHSPVLSSHVLRWAYSETVTDIEHHIPHWVQQGTDYIARQQAWEAFDKSERVSDLAVWRQPDARTLEEMYGAKDEEQRQESLTLEFGKGGERLKERFNILGYQVTQNMLDDMVDEEQEREVSHEVEKERQVQRPPRKEPAAHMLRDSVREFVHSGIVRDSRTFIPLFKSLNLPLNSTHRGLLSTLDFAITIRGSEPALNDFMRPVTWVISGGRTDDWTPALVIISPFEADQLRSEIAKNKVGLHLHVYAPKVTQNQESFDDLGFLTIPPISNAPGSNWTPPDPLMITQLNLFAGQLYFHDWAAYKQLCDYLGLYIPGDDSSRVVAYQSDGFVLPKDRRGEMKRLCPFETSPLPKLKELFGLRRKGNGYSFTHIGKILSGRALDKRDFE